MRSEAPLSIKNWQQLFKKAIQNKLPVSEFHNLKIVPQKRVSVRHRIYRIQGIQVYQYAYRTRIRESLADDFSGFFRQVGAQKFDLIVDDYRERYPSRFSSLAEYSEGFSSFLEKNALVYGLSFQLIDRAKRDWIRVRLFFAPAVEEEGFRFSEGVIHELDRLTVRLNPLAVFYRSSEEAKNRVYILWRSRWQVRERVLKKNEWKVLQLLDSKVLFLDWVSQLEQLGISAQQAQKMVAKLTREGLILAGF